MAYNPPCRGRIDRHPNYRESPIEEYRGNPWIEALPPIWPEDEVVARLRHSPHFSSRIRQEPAQIRIHQAVSSLLKFREPLANWYVVERSISLLLRQGYIDRNPSDPAYFPSIAQRVKTLDYDPRERATDEYVEDDAVVPTTHAYGMGIIGLAGVGKSSSIQLVLKQYPQVIWHQEYLGQPLPVHQLVWLKIDCPHNGNPKGLCSNFFAEVDAVLDSNYAQLYPIQSLSEGELLKAMARLSGLHGLGILVIDELQHLSLLKSGGHRRLLNFLVQLVNKMGTPIVLIGNPAAQPLLAGEFRQARRASTCGDLVWVPMKPDSDEWNYFVESLWPYQFTRHPLPWDSAEGKAARDALYETSQGIADFVVKVWILGHFRAMDSGEERLTAEVLRSAVTDHLKLSQSIMDLIAANQWTELQRYEDVYYPGLEQWRPNVPPQDIDVETAIITWLEAGGIPESIAIESARDASRKAETSDLMTLRQQAYQAALTKLAEASTPKDNATKSHRGKSKPAQKSSKTKDPLTESDLYADPKEWTTP